MSDRGTPPQGPLFRSVGEMLGLSVPDVCVCGKLIPLELDHYYGFPLDENNDAEMAFVNPWHDLCLGEWGYVRDDSDFGIRHRFCDDELQVA